MQRDRDKACMVHQKCYNKITKTLFLQIFGHAAFIKQNKKFSTKAIVKMYV